MTKTTEDEIVDRRNLLSLLGASLGAAALAACRSPNADANGDALGVLSQALTSGTNIKVADVVAQLGAMAGGIVGDANNPAIVIVQGYSSVNDGGGGIFLFVQTGLTPDGGTIFAATNGYWARLYSGPLDLRWFGAKANDSSGAAAIANTTAIVNAIKASGQFGDTNPPTPLAYNNQIFVPRGKFYLSDDLILDRTVTLFGAGMNWQTTLVFPADKSLVIPAKSDNPLPDNENSSCTVRDLTLESLSNWQVGDGPTVDSITWYGPSNAPPAIRMLSYATLQNLFITGFRGNGIEIVASGHDNPPSHSEFWRINNCQIDRCGGHGLYVAGDDAHGGVCIGLVTFDVGGCGIHDKTGGGSTYVSCYVAPALPGGGYAYHTAQNTQAAFVGCRSEGNASKLLGGSVYLGGTNGGGLTSDSQCLYGLGTGDVAPFVVSKVDPINGKSVQAIIGSDTEHAIGWNTTGYVQNYPWLLKWVEGELIWALVEGYSIRAAYFTSTSDAGVHPRGHGLQGFPEVLIGPATGSNIKIEVGTEAIVAGHYPGNPGDRIYNTDPVVGGPAGWIYAKDANGVTYSWRPFGTIG